MTPIRLPFSRLLLACLLAATGLPVCGAQEQETPTAARPSSGGEPAASDSYPDAGSVTREEFSALVRRLAATEAELRRLRAAPADASNGGGLSDEYTAVGGSTYRAAPGTLPSRLPDSGATFDGATSLLDASVAPGAAAPAAPAPEKKFPTVQVNGVFQADTGFFHQDANSVATYGHIQDGAAFRRARLSAKGSVTETMNYFMQMDFAFFGRPTFTDVWLESVDFPVLGNVRIGQWKQPFSLEVVSSFRYTTFMERSVLFQPFTPFRHLGIGFYNHSDDLKNTWAASFFRSGQDQFGGSISTDGGWGTAERVTWLPYWDDATEGESYLHLGAGHYFNSPPKDAVNFRTIPEFYVGENASGVVGTSGQAAPGGFDGTPYFLKTGTLSVSQFNVFGSELLLVRGPWSVQAEGMLNYVQPTSGNSAVLPGAYVQVGWFLTGEHRPYDRVAGAIDRVIPHENFFRVNTVDGPATGMGAWEVAARWSRIDLSDQGIHGGQMTDWTLGLNWYMNPYSKLVFNYIRSQPDVPGHGRSDTDIFAMRAQLDF